MTRKNLPVILEPEEAQNLLRQPNKRYPTRLRNKAMMSLMLHCGLRISEVINLRPSNINLTKGKLRVENGKGNKDRDLANIASVFLYTTILQVVQNQALMTLR